MVIFGAGILRNSKFRMNLVFVIASQVCCPVSCMLVVMQGHLQTSVKPWDHVGLQKQTCSQEQAVSVGSVLLFLFPPPFGRTRPRSKACQCTFSEALGFSSEPAQGIVSF